MSFCIQFIIDFAFMDAKLKIFVYIHKKKSKNWKDSNFGKIFQ